MQIVRMNIYRTRTRTEDILHDIYKISKFDILLVQLLLVTKSKCLKVCFKKNMSVVFGN